MEVTAAAAPASWGPMGQPLQGLATVVARGAFEDGLHVGAWDSARGAAMIGFGGRAVAATPYEALAWDTSLAAALGAEIVLVPAAGGKLPALARSFPVVIPVPVGFEASGELLYAAVDNDTGTVGKTAPHLGGCNVADSGQERASSGYALVCVRFNRAPAQGLVASDTESLLEIAGLGSPFDSALLPADQRGTQRIRRYIPDVSSLLSWSRSDVPASELHDDAEFRKEYVVVPDKPRVLHCHDMMGGYCKGADKDYLAVFDSWFRIDIFVYFSHRRVSIPPKVWIDKCHRNLKPCLATFITEGSDGVSENELLLRDPAKSADILADIAATYGFDGYLINFESSVPSFEAVKVFLEALTRRCKEVIGPHSLVIQYDSITRHGTVGYENSLTATNLPLFEACDGLFTNYWWTNSKLKHCREFVGGPDLASRVFFGVDVFGRGTTYLEGPEAGDAAKLALNKGFSVALFAPGWSVENGPAGKALKDGDLELAKSLDSDFWRNLLERNVETEVGYKDITLDSIGEEVRLPSAGPIHFIETQTDLV